MRLKPFALASALALAAALGACADSRTGNVFVSPARFTLYNCRELADYQIGLVDRRRQLEGLMAKAKQEASGSIVNTIAYEPDYQTALGELKVLRQEAAQKGCNLPDSNALPPAAPVSAKPAKPAKPKR